MKKSLAQGIFWDYSADNANKIAIDLTDSVRDLLRASGASTDHVAEYLGTNRDHLGRFKGGTLNKLRDTAKPELARLAAKYTPPRSLTARPIDRHPSITQEQIDEQLLIAAMIEARQAEYVQPTQSAMF